MNLDHVFKKPNQHRRILSADAINVEKRFLRKKCGTGIISVRNVRDIFG